VIDARGLVVAPGFINMLSWSVVSLIQDGRSQSEIRQGVTTEIMGEGESMGPLNDELKKRMLQLFADIKWNTLAEYLAISASRAMWRRFSAQTRSANMSSDLKTSSRRHNSWTRCASSSGRRWRRRARDRLGTHVSAGVFRQDRRTDRALQSGGQIPGQIRGSSL